MSPKGSKRRKSAVRRPPVRQKAGKKPSLGWSVELAIHIADGFDRQHRRVRLAAPIRVARSKGQDRRLPGLQVREAAARRIAGGCNPAHLAGLLAALAHPQRLVILLTLMPCEGTHKALSRATGLKAGPLYHHLRELRAAGLIGPKVRDVYQLTALGRRILLGTLALERLSG